MTHTQTTIGHAMPIMLKRTAQHHCDEASKYLQILGKLGFDVSDAMDNIRDINLALVEEVKP